MGIPGYFKGFIEQRARNAKASIPTASGKYAKVLQDDLPKNVTALEIDANALAYTAAEYCYALDRYAEDAAVLARVNYLSPVELDEACYQMTLDIIIYIIRDVRPIQRVGISFDGVVPKPKMEQQRMRRYASALNITADSRFDPSCITPGTNWMQRLDTYFRAHLPGVIETLRGEGIGAEIVYSSHLVPGEGEHKMFLTMKRSRGDKQVGTGITVIYGGDADLILIAMASDVNGILIYRDIPFEVDNPYVEAHAEKSRKYVRLVPKFDLSPSIINIDHLKAAITEELRPKSSAIHDFVFTMTLLGNDFIPRQASFMKIAPTIDDLMSALALTRLSIVDPETYGVNWAGVLELFTLLVNDKRVKNETNRIVTVSKNIVKGRDVLGSGRMVNLRAGWRPYEAAVELTEDLTQSLELGRNFRKAWYYNALSPKSGRDMMEVTDIISKFEIERGDINAMAVSYLIGMNWTYTYYTRHTENVTWLWYYPYHYAPLIVDLERVLKRILDKSSSALLEVNPKPKEVRFTPLHQMIYVLPPASAIYAPRFLRPLWSDSSPIVDIMPFEIVVDQDMEDANPRNTYYASVAKEKTKDWQGKAILPFATPDRLFAAIDLLELSQEELETYKYSTVKTYGVWQESVEPFTEPYRGQRGDRKKLSFRDKQPEKTKESYGPSGRGRTEYKRAPRGGRSNAQTYLSHF